jgi:hypothetical protein
MNRLMRLIRRAARLAVRAWQFCRDVHFYWWGLDYRFSRAVRTARDTIH